MLVLLVRHGHAGTKRGWRGHDDRRPLNEQGRAEAGALASLLIPYRPARIVSSPFLRCVQSVTPLGDAVGIGIETSLSLVPDAGEAAALQVLEVAAAADAGAMVVCTHGEVVHDLQTHFGADGLASFGPESPREKASVWVLERRDGRFIGATYLPPPSLEP
jgi:phosphohistidine phosphatase SixA